MRLDPLALRPSARSARGSCGPGSAAYIGQAKAPPKRALMSVTRRPSSRSRNICTVAGPRSGSASATARPRSISSGSAIAGALDRLAAARFEHRARDRVQAAAVAVAQQVDGELGAVHAPLHHHRLLDVAGEELRLALVGARVDRARARALARLDHRRDSRRGSSPGSQVGGLGRPCDSSSWCARYLSNVALQTSASGTNAGRSLRASTSRSRSVSGITALTSCSLAPARSGTGCRPDRRRAAARRARRRRTGRAPAGSGRRRRRTRAARTS